jgi:hypothetical protein
MFSERNEVEHNNNINIFSSEARLCTDINININSMVAHF